MKKQYMILAVLVLALGSLPVSGQGKTGGQGPSAAAGERNNQAIINLTASFAARDFISGEVPRGDIDTILECASRAPSARNGQPWHFTVVRDPALGRKIISNLTGGNIILVISGRMQEGGDNTGVVLDCGLATQNIYLAAQALGLGSRIYTGPVNTINSSLLGELGLPRNYRAVAVVRIGQVKAGTDGVSGASGRNSLDRMVNYK